ncbi:MAG: hypothetical protein PHN49_04810 [Candidatus Omnitrophica bacterium]|nr:hypothetical protein [Candidatus Omnitrophota bacterium]MDD5670941.1 hypothetical protein [Candidatus Omnitrophota bacterium]
MSFKSSFWQWCLRLLAMALCFLSIREAIAGVWYYQGMQATYQGELTKSLLLLECAKHWGDDDLHILYPLAQCRWFLGVKNKDALLIEQALDEFEKITREYPWYGRAWLYLAEGRIYLKDMTGTKLTAPEWTEALRWVGKASRLEPGSAWVAYHVGVVLLSHPEYRDPSTVGNALAAFRKASKLVPRIYLAPSLAYLWKRSGNFEWLLKITPRDYKSFKILQKFLDKNHLWCYRPFLDAALREFKADLYEASCREADQYWVHNNYRRAYKAYRRAFWADQVSSRARVGMMIAHEALYGKINWDYRKVLEEIFEREEDIQDIVDFLPYMNPIVNRVKDPYILGLYSYHRGRWQETIDELETATAGKKYRRRYLARAYAEAGQRDKALEVLKPAMDEENPDLRELILLSEWLPSRKSQIDDKIKKMTKRYYSDKNWRSRNPDPVTLDRNGTVGMEVNLKPGWSSFSIPMRGVASGKGYYGYVLARIGRDLVMSFYVDSTRWERKSFDIFTTGGKRWLSLELINGTEGPSPEKGPVTKVGMAAVQ